MCCDSLLLMMVIWGLGDLVKNYKSYNECQSSIFEWILASLGTLIIMRSYQLLAYSWAYLDVTDEPTRMPIDIQIWQVNWPMIPCLYKMSYLMLGFALLIAYLANLGTYVFATIYFNEGIDSDKRCLVDSESYTFVISLLLMVYVTMGLHIFLLC